MPRKMNRPANTFFFFLFPAYNERRAPIRTYLEKKSLLEYTYIYIYIFHTYTYRNRTTSHLGVGLVGSQRRINMNSYPDAETYVLKMSLRNDNL